MEKYISKLLLQTQHVTVKIKPHFDISQSHIVPTHVPHANEVVFTAQFWFGTSELT